MAQGTAKRWLLGDVVISRGIVQFEFGRQYSDKVIRKDTLEDNLGRPTQEFRAFLRKMEGMRGRTQLENSCKGHLDALCNRMPQLMEVSRSERGHTIPANTSAQASTSRYLQRLRGVCKRRGQGMRTGAEIEMS